jgi:hypothetical protein
VLLVLWLLLWPLQLHQIHDAHAVLHAVPQLLLLRLLLRMLQLYVLLEQLSDAVVDEHADILAPVTSGV